MKTLAVWTLMAVVMIASQPSYAFGDLLFHTVLKNAMEDKRMPDVAPVPTDTIPKVVEPVPTTRMPCTTSNVVAAARGDLDEEELNLLDQNCNPHTTELSTSASAMGFGLSVAEETCAMWYPTSTVLGLFGAWTSNPPKDYVRYGAGYAHKDCVPQ